MESSQGKETWVTFSLVTPPYAQPPPPLFSSLGLPVVLEITFSARVRNFGWCGGGKEKEGKERSEREMNEEEKESRGWD